MSVRIVLSTVGSAEDAERIASSLVESRLAACVNLVPGILSVYRWKGAVEREAEQLLVIKTTEDRCEELKAELLRLHPYQLPEIVCLPVEIGHTPYLDWVVASTRAASNTPAG